MTLQQLGYLIRHKIMGIEDPVLTALRNEVFLIEESIRELDHVLPDDQSIRDEFAGLIEGKLALRGEIMRMANRRERIGTTKLGV